MEDRDEEKRKVVKEELNKIILAIEEKISNLERDLKREKKGLIDIDTIQKELNKISKQLGNYKTIINNTLNLYKDFEEFLKQQQNDLKNSNIIIIEVHKEQLIKLINENLPDTMSVRKLENVVDQWKIILKTNEKAEDNQSILGKKSIKKINYFIDGENFIGDMSLFEAEGEAFIKIKILGEETFQDFKIDNPLKVFPIVNHIITRYHYQEEKHETVG